MLHRSSFADTQHLLTPCTYYLNIPDYLSASSATEMARQRQPPVRTSKIVAKRYTKDRAIKKPHSTWERYKTLFLKLWITFDFSVKQIQIYVLNKYRERFSQRQIQHRMDKWGWAKYKTAKKSKSTSAVDEDSIAPESETSCSLDAPGERDPPALLESHFESKMFEGMDDTGEEGFGPKKENLRSIYFDTPLKLKADIARALQDHQTAFDCYWQLGQDAKGDTGRRPEELELLVIALFRAAISQSEEQRAAKLLQDLVPDLDHRPDLALQTSLYQMCANQAPGAVGDAALRQNVKIHLDNVRWPAIPRSFSSVDLGTWLAIIHVLCPLPEKNDEACSYDQKFLATQPIKSWTTTYREGDPGKPSAFLDCMEWTTRKLRQIPETPINVPQFLQVIKPDKRDVQILNHLILFLSLLDLALPQRNQLSWWSLSEPETSISPVTLLSTICRMLLSEPPFGKGKDPVLSRDLILQSDGSANLSSDSAAVVAAEEMTRREPDYLWSAFLGTLATEDETDLTAGDLLVHVRQYLETFSLDASCEEDVPSARNSLAHRDLAPLPVHTPPPPPPHQDLGWSADEPFTHGFMGAPDHPYEHVLPSSFNVWPAS
ncbi:hypothetical protein NLU13_4776 [Sarocladium strictum]|uniref:Clr5 domain-containing protein n=1 Tax=Sarocladium strictum TaxID=5046 RepID=A0AA39L905_SARSR|nr:hypothetical protein NLU13_4776 [Sarocladium strictum]